MSIFTNFSDKYDEKFEKNLKRNFIFCKDFEKQLITIINKWSHMLLAFSKKNQNVFFFVKLLRQIETDSKSFLKLSLTRTLSTKLLDGSSYRKLKSSDSKMIIILIHFFTKIKSSIGRQIFLWSALVQKCFNSQVKIFRKII